jgi:3-isopropylmalate dehydratase small subunit
VRPTVAPAGRGGDVAALAEFAPARVDRVFVGTCAGGTFEEIAAFADALGERAAVPTLVAPASAAIEARLRAAGILDRLAAAGVALLAPGCGPCFGFGVGRLGDGEVAAATGNRNGVGRMGSPTSHGAPGRRRHGGRGGAHGVAGGGGGRRAGGRPGGGSSGVAGAVSGAGVLREPLTVAWPRAGNVVRLHGTVTTDDLTPSVVPGVGVSSDRDPAVLRRLLLAHAAPEAATRDLRGCVVVADHDFGMGSNRASAVRALLLAGVVAVVARSVSPLYAAGARDEGLAVVELDDDAFYAAAGPDARVAVDLEVGTVRVDARAFAVAAATPFERAVCEAGGIVAYLRATRDVGAVAVIESVVDAGQRGSANGEVVHCCRRSGTGHVLGCATVSQSLTLPFRTSTAIDGSTRGSLEPPRPTDGHRPYGVIEEGNVTQITARLPDELVAASDGAVSQLRRTRADSIGSRRIPT